MNMQGGWALVRKSFFSYTASRGFFWTLAFGWMVAPLVYMFVWMTAAGTGRIAGFGRSDFVAYYLCAIVVNQLTYPVSNWTVGDVIRTGGFSHWLLRPIAAIYEAIATDAATKIVCVPFVLALTIGIGVVLRPAIAVSAAGVLAFVAALALAQVIRFLLAYTLALLALWTDRADALLSLNDTFIFLLAGMVAPTALLPGAMGVLADVLPYRYMIGFPIEVLMGRLSPAEMWLGFGRQLVWLAILLAAHHLVWRRGIKHYSAVGG